MRSIDCSAALKVAFSNESSYPYDMIMRMPFACTASHTPVFLYMFASLYLSVPRELTLRGLLLKIASGLLEAEVALLVSATGTKSDTDESRPRSPLEQEDREDDTKSEAEGRLDEEVREAAVPLGTQLATPIQNARRTAL
jgi:hypothetical protein